MTTKWCEFAQIDQTRDYACGVCHKVVRGVTQLPIWSQCGNQEVADGPCVHLVEYSRLVECPTCAGSVKVKVFACQVHGECTLAKKIEGLACCEGCAQYKAE